MLYKPLFLVALTPVAAFACLCEGIYPVCQEVATSDVVFIGTVESVGPAFLDPWHWRDPGSAVPVEEIERLRQDGSPTAAKRLKTIYLRMVDGLTNGDKEELATAATFPEVEAAFNAIAVRDRRAHFKVSTMFREAKDDDDDQDGKALKNLDVRTPQDDCGIDFQKGETYLVYADNDEETGKLSTSICYRTKRLSDAGSDLAYLHFFREGGNASSRIEGFVTSERNQDRQVRLNRVDSPVPNLVVALKSPAAVLYTRSGPDGRFVFDGVEGGYYELTVFGQAFPRTSRVMAGPQRVDVPPKGCAGPMMVVSPRDIGEGR